MRKDAWLPGLLILVCSSAVTKTALAGYNLPAEAKFTLERNQNGQSFLELRFTWSREKPPNFDPGVAVEFEIHVDNKCFIQPSGGIDDQSDCIERLGKDNFELPNDNVRAVRSASTAYKPITNNCYVDVWNYWAPNASVIGPLVAFRCGLIRPFTAACISALDLSGELTDKEANFAVGLHEAHGRLVAGKEYWFRYPVEVNNTPDCVSTYGKRIDEGLAWVNMQFFKNECIINPACDLEVANSNPPYVYYPGPSVFTCPELIGASEGCIGHNKDNQLWIDNLCVPTRSFSFSPQKGTYVVDRKNVCEGREGKHTIKSCCVDLDDDGYFKTQSVPTYGSRTGDCNDNNPNIYPRAPEIPGDGIDQDCSGRDGGLSTSSVNCSNDVQDGDETDTDCGGSCPPCESSATCMPGQSAPCGNCGTMTCSADGTWGACQNEGACTPGESQARSCGNNGTQTTTCSESCEWEPWSTCDERCVCLSGQCCDGCHFSPTTQLCNNWRERRCQGPNPGQDVEEYYGAVYCSGRDAGCNGEEIRNPWYVSSDCSSNEVCDPVNVTCVPAPSSCGASSYWSPSSDDELSPIGYQIDRTQPIPLRLQVRQDVEGGNNLEVQVCKEYEGTTFDNDIAFYITAFEGGILEVETLATRGRICSNWLDIPGTNTYREGQTFNGVWHIVSPASSRSDWNFPYTTCSGRPGAGGTCWSGHSLALTRTCR